MKLTKQNNGGPAFPPFHDPKNQDSGMTLRDYFAAHIVAGFCVNSTSDYDIDAKMAYKQADAMLSAREK